MGDSTVKSYGDSSGFQPPSATRDAAHRPSGPSETTAQIDHEQAASQAATTGVKPRQIQGGHPAVSTAPSPRAVLMGMVGSNSGLLGRAAKALATSRAAAENGSNPPN